MNADPIERYVFDARRLVEEFPPVWRHPSKRMVYELVCPPDAQPRGTMVYTRWAPMPLPERIDMARAAGLLETRDGVYDYVPVDESAEEWHVNFADPLLFVAYGSPMFAQDEMQVLEHPALGSLREALIARGSPAVTVEGTRPTPVLVHGVERRCRVATDPNPVEGRPSGLYGRAFARATQEAVLRATTRLDPPTVTHLIAMAAPAGGYGLYSPDDVKTILVTAYTGFRAAVLESHRNRGESCPVVVHTGYWGCGAFGGNRVLMPILQALAASASGLDRLVFHTAGDPVGVEGSQAWLRRQAAAVAEAGTNEVIARILSEGFRWRTGNGN